MHLLTTLLVIALSPVLAAAPAAPVRGPEPAQEKQEQRAPVEEQEQEEKQAPAPPAPMMGRVVLRADGPQEHGPSFEEAPEPPLTPDRPPALRARRLAAALPQSPPVLESSRADVRAGILNLPPPVA